MLAPRTAAVLAMATTCLLFAACAGEIGSGIDASRDGFGDGSDGADRHDAVDVHVACTTETQWECSADHESRIRCSGQYLEMESCPHGCLGGTATTDAYCAAPCGAPPTDSPTWTCSSDGMSRGRCVNGGAEIEMCHMGCHVEPAGTDAFCNEACAGSASGTSSVWTCTSDFSERQRCNDGVVETEHCSVGACVPQPSGANDLCPPDPSMGNATLYCSGGHCLHWWDCRITYQYQYTSSHDWDTDMHVADGTPIILPHRSRLTAIYYAGAGFQPEFTDLVTGAWMHFNHLHLNSEFGGSNTALGPVQLVSLSDPNHTDHIYPAGWVIGFSGGGTRHTGYAGTDSAGNVCSGGYSTAAHLCVVTTSAHTIDQLIPSDGGSCSPVGWPPGLWSELHARAPSYATCPSVCTGCGQPHF